MNQKKIDELMQRRHQFVYAKEGEERKAAERTKT